ncbi:hypothetical protein ACHWQZ_G018085 [Mnemiopsis leidyi]
MVVRSAPLFCLCLLYFVVYPGQGQIGDQGCNHDGKRYDIGATVIVGCDECICELGHIKCPDNPTCPRMCHYKGKPYEHGAEWVGAVTCNQCKCNDGTILCIAKECSDSCEVNGYYYKKGDIVMKHCEQCECLGHDRLKCADHFCPCNIENEFVEHGGLHVDNSDPLGSITYRCDDGRLAIEEDNRIGLILPE